MIMRVAWCVTLAFNFSIHSAAAPCHNLVKQIIGRSGLTSLCTRLADRIIATPGQIDWFSSPYDLLKVKDRNALQGAFESGLNNISDKRHIKLQMILQRAPLFHAVYTDAGACVDLRLTLFDVFRQEQHLLMQYQQQPHVKVHLESSCAGDKTRKALAATSYAVRLFDTALHEVAMRIDAERY